MIYNMKLQRNPFELIKNGSKTIELRLYDEKRRLIKIGDLIDFTNIDTNEVLHVKVKALHIFKDFNDLYNHFNKISIGYKEQEEATPIDMEKYYSKEEQMKYNVVGIEIELV